MGPGDPSLEASAPRYKYSKGERVGLTVGPFILPMILHIDFETRSTLELKAVGVHKYAAHPTTDVWCLGWAIDDQEPKIWAPEHKQPCRAAFLVREGVVVVAHNAVFELEIWNQIMAPRYGWPPLKPSQVRCTMAQAYAMSLPGSLENAAAALGLTVTKDAKGHRLMMQMARPKGYDVLGDPYWWDDDAHTTALYEYCKQDVRVEQQLHQRLLPLSDEEQALWELDYAINRRGLYLDQPAIVSAMAIIGREQERLQGDIRQVTNGAVGSPAEVAALTRWVVAQGVDADGLAKADVLDLLADDGLPAHVRTALEIRQAYAKTSTAKLNRMLDAASEDGRIRFTMQYHGAGTGRWAGRRLQPHNMPRPKLKQAEIESILAQVTRSPQADDWIRVFYGEPLEVIADCLRGMICAAPGNTLVAGDFSNIEGRVLAWLAGEAWKLQAFRDFDVGVGPDIYRLAYAKAFGIPVDTVNKDQRQVGKVMELALGYQGGVGAFQTMARGYGVKVTDERANEIKQLWRDTHPRIVAYWTSLEQAAVGAVSHPGAKTTVRAASFVRKGSFLFCRLPSGRLLTYPYPQIKSIETPWGEMKEQVHYKKVDGLTKKWGEAHAYGGLWAENITQATARDILAAALTRLDAAGFQTVAHIHDEAVAEMPLRHKWLPALLEVLKILPSWAEGLPIAAEGWEGRRFRK